MQAQCVKMLTEFLSARNRSKPHWFSWLRIGLSVTFLWTSWRVISWLVQLLLAFPDRCYHFELVCGWGNNCVFTWGFIEEELIKVHVFLYIFRCPEKTISMQLWDWGMKPVDLTRNFGCIFSSAMKQLSLNWNIVTF